MSRSPGKPQKRIVQLDILRGIAILLVLGAHLPVTAISAGVLKPAGDLWHHFGWTGVDLFFVLSGFLVGGLLFAELRTRGYVDVRRFLIRRAFKIWPAYYVFLIFTFARELLNGGSPGAVWHRMVPQLVHLQNYLGTVAEHTWTLAVEEHFYLALPCALALIGIRNPGGLKKSWAIPGIALFLTVTCTYLRSLHHTGRIAETHLRIDSLFFGVLLAYLQHFHPERLLFAGKHPRVLLLVGLALISPMFVLGGMHPLVYTLGLVMLYLGYGAILLAVMRLVPDNCASPTVAGFVGRAIAFVGYYSYSIYLWHNSLAGSPTRAFWRMVIHRGALPAEVAWLAAAMLYAGLAVFTGVLSARLVEMPALRMRERLFPALTRKDENRPPTEVSRETIPVGPAVLAAARRP